MNHYPFFPGGQPAWPAPTESVFSADRTFQSPGYAHFVARGDLPGSVEMTWAEFKKLWTKRFGSVYEASGTTGIDYVEAKLFAVKCGVIRKAAKQARKARAPHGGVYSRAVG